MNTDLHVKNPDKGSESSCYRNTELLFTLGKYFNFSVPFCTALQSD